MSRANNITITVARRGPAGRDGVAGLPPGEPGQVLGYGLDGVPMAIDAPQSGGPPCDDRALVERVAALDAPLTGRVAILEQKPAPAPYDDTTVKQRLTAVEQGLSSLPPPYNPQPLTQRVTAAEAGVSAAQTRADAAYSLAQQGAGDGTAYDDSDLRQRIALLENKPAPVFIIGLRVAGGTLYLDLSDGTSLSAALPAGGTPPPDPTDDPIWLITPTTRITPATRIRGTA